MSLRRIFRAVLLVFLKEAGKEVEFAIFPGGNTNLLVTVAVTVVAVTVVAVTVVAVTVSVVTVTVSVKMGLGRVVACAVLTMVVMWMKWKA